MPGGGASSLLWPSTTSQVPPARSQEDGDPQRILECSHAVVLSRMVVLLLCRRRRRRCLLLALLLLRAG